MNEKFGIANIKILLGLLIKLGVVGDEIGRDSKTNIFVRFFKLVQAVPEAIELLKIEWKTLGLEVKDLDAVERAELEEFIKEKLVLGDKNLETIIESAIGIMIELGELIEKFIGLFNGIKKKD